ncbi:DNA-directed RNA polymerase subunit RPC12/RpoP [Alkalibacillus flavidus]|uniref:DNA-directed RNA polymerase subunit RPC12/RpoP n=1 Tax=Alkalibacillus flavidus TaxID=546021 RepID=A0ABV2L0V3_9BACI
MDSLSKDSVQNNGRDGVVCSKCHSKEIVANKRGYSFSIMFLVLFSFILLAIVVMLANALFSDLYFMFFGMLSGMILGLSLPVAIVSGFVGRSNIVNGCMNCGHKWLPKSKK